MRLVSIIASVVLVGSFAMATEKKAEHTGHGAATTTTTTTTTGTTAGAEAGAAAGDKKTACEGNAEVKSAKGKKAKEAAMKKCMGEATM